MTTTAIIFQNIFLSDSGATAERQKKFEFLTRKNSNFSFHFVIYFIFSDVLYNAKRQLYLELLGFGVFVNQVFEYNIFNFVDKFRQKGARYES